MDTAVVGPLIGGESVGLGDWLNGDDRKGGVQDSS